MPKILASPRCESAEPEAQSSQKADLFALLARYKERANALDLYTEAYRRYCWDVENLDDYRIAPFHILRRTLTEEGVQAVYGPLRRIVVTVTDTEAGHIPIFKNAGCQGVK